MDPIRITVDGIAVKVNREVFADFRTLHALAKARKGDMFAVCDLTEALFGDQLDDIVAKLPDTNIPTVFAFAVKCIEAAAEAQGENAKN